MKSSWVVSLKSEIGKTSLKAAWRPVSFRSSGRSSIWRNSRVGRPLDGQQVGHREDGLDLREIEPVHGKYFRIL